MPLNGRPGFERRARVARLHRFALAPVSASTLATSTDALFDALLIVSALIVLLVLALIVTFAARYRRGWNLVAIVRDFRSFTVSVAGFERCYVGLHELVAPAAVTQPPENTRPRQASSLRKVMVCSSWVSSRGLHCPPSSTKCRKHTAALD